MAIHNPCPLTAEQIMSPARFAEAVTRGGMDPRHYAYLVAMALACIEMNETWSRFIDAETGKQ